jgi:hypothetical protein
MNFFRRTFARAAALAFLAEAVVHVLILIHRNLRLQPDPDFRLSHIPLWADALMLIIGGYGVLGLWIFFQELRIRRCRTCFWYGFITLFLTITVLLHTYILLFDHAHKILEMFPQWYSWIGLAYCIAYAVTLLRMRLLPEEA